MRKSSLVGIRLILIAASGSIPLIANAADLYRTPPPSPNYSAPVAVPSDSWAGFYVGLNGGYGWSSTGSVIDYNGGFLGSDSSGRALPNGGFGGAQVGYNFQSGRFVYGIEADFQGGDLSDRIAGTTAAGNAFSDRERVDWFGTARGRLGYSFGRTLFYATGGFAYGDVRQRALVTGVDTVSLGGNNVQTGFTVGGGLEYKISPNWSLKAEYQYIDLGSEKLNGFDSTGAAIGTNNIDTNFHTVRVGVNYRFGGGYEPLK